MNKEKFDKNWFFNKKTINNMMLYGLLEIWQLNSEFSVNSVNEY